MDVRDYLLNARLPWTQAASESGLPFNEALNAHIDLLAKACNYALSGGLASLFIYSKGTHNVKSSSTHVENILDDISTRLLTKISFHGKYNIFCKIEIFVDESLVDSREAVVDGD